MNKPVCNYGDCSVNEGLIEATGITGKRGRPPRYFYCPEHFESEKKAGNCKEAGPKLSKEEKERLKTLSRVRKPRQNKEGIKSVGVTHPEAAFLVTLQYENMFEFVPDQYGQSFRCKCCDEEVRRQDRQEHHAYHKGVEFHPSVLDAFAEEWKEAMEDEDTDYMIVTVEEEEE